MKISELIDKCKDHLYGHQWKQLKADYEIKVKDGFFVLPPDYEAVLNSKVEEP